MLGRWTTKRNPNHYLYGRAWREPLGKRVHETQTRDSPKALLYTPLKSSTITTTESRQRFVDGVYFFAVVMPGRTTSAATCPGPFASAPPPPPFACCCCCCCCCCCSVSSHAAFEATAKARCVFFSAQSRSACKRAICVSKAALSVGS